MNQLAASVAFERCVNEFHTLLTIANVALWVAVVAAIVIPILTLLVKIAENFSKPVLSPRTSGGAEIAGVFESLKGLVVALAAAPPWFAIFLAGILLLWCAGRFTPAACRDSLIHTLPDGSKAPQSMPGA